MNRKAVSITSIFLLFSVLSITLYLINSAGAFQSGDKTFKLTYDLIVSDTTGIGIVYTPHCFECHLPINFSYSGTSAPDTATLLSSDFSHTFNKLNQNDDISIVKINLLINKSFIQTTWIPNITCETINENSTSYEKCTDNGSLISVPSWKFEWEALPSSIALEKGKWYVIDFIGKRTPTFNSYATDIIPIINSISLSELAWWNTSYDYRTNFTIATDIPRVPMGGNTFNRTFIPIMHSTTSLVDSGKMQSNCNDYEWLNSTNDESNWVWENYTHNIYGCYAGNTTVWFYEPVLDNNASNVTVYYGYGSDTTLGNKTRPNEVLAEWHFSQYYNNETFTDSSSRTNNVTKRTGTFAQEAGLFGLAGKFDGSTDYTFSDNADFQNLVGHTSFALFKVRDNGISYLFSSASGANGFHWFYDDNFNGLNCYYLVEGTEQPAFVDITLNQEQWYAVACRFTPNVKTEIWLYNGTAFYYGIDNTGVGSQVDSDGVLAVGGEANNGAPARLNGVIDFQAHVNGTLTDVAINATLNALFNSRYTVILNQGEENQTVANEAQGRSAIEEGIRHSLGSTALIYTDQQVYARYLNTSQQSATFDKFTQNNTKRWAINYLNVGGILSNMQNITPSLYVLEMSNMTSANIRLRVSTFINETR